MVILKRLLAAIDFSTCSHLALKHACALAERFGAELHLLHVTSDYGSTVYVPELGCPPPAATPHDARQQAQKELATLPDARWEAVGRVVREVRFGSPFVEIVRYAKEHEIDLIVLGTHGRSGLAHMLLGSVAENVVRKAPCPVLTVRPEGHQFVMP